MLQQYYFFFNNFEKKIIKDKNKLYVVFSIFFLIFFDTLLQFFYGKNLLGFELPYDRATSFLGSKLILGNFLFTVLPLILWLIFFYRLEIEKNKLFLIFFLVYISFAFIFLAKEHQ